ncbi:hypothetical protein RhiirA5_384746 [Rhizophagus irregularis]|uniref:Uncharacterized protein n=1 Tax=Rhizophagus irregularis TaxID=588596 RepID=A0A2N0NRX4_9GLOM|nr:hypothetical protein RhiirA5_384746 [Rhizophagus irregularis]
MAEIKMTFSNLEKRHLSNCKDYKDEKVMCDKLISQFENIESFEKLNRTSRNLHRLVEGHMEISHDTILLMELSIDQLDKTQKRLGNELSKKKTKLKKTQDELKDTKAMTKLLSVDRDWIGIFNWKLKKKLGENVFSEIKEAMDDARIYQTDITQCSCVKKLEEILEKVGMSFKDFKLLFETKQLSNEKFHKSPGQTIKDAKEQLLNDSFPEEQKNLITSLTKLFNALEIWDPRH